MLAWIGIYGVGQLIDQEKINKLCLSKNPEERAEASKQIIENFPLLPNKQQAWNTLFGLTNDEDWRVRSMAASGLGHVFSHLPNKEQAWDNLHTLTNNKSRLLRSRAASGLGSAYFYLPDKQQAWDDLHRLANDDEMLVRYWATSALGYAFPLLPKQQAWGDLHRLTDDLDNSVKSIAASALGSVFSHVPDKQQAWNDLYKLTSVEDRFVRSKAVSALGSAFPYLPDKQQAWDILCKLTSDQEEDVRGYANYSLGKISIFRASHAEKEEYYKEELEKSIEFFERVSRELWFNPAKFCLLFYRSFYMIIFKKEDAKEEVTRYLAEAKIGVQGSKSKALLLDAVENLSSALKLVQNLENVDLQVMKDELNFYRTYCDRAVELMENADEKAPFATEVLRKGLPILDRNLKEILEEIQNKAKKACQESQGTLTQEIACTVNREVQKWEIGSQEEMTFNIDNLIFTLESNILRAPENQFIFDKIQQIREQKDLAKQYGILCVIIPLIPKLHMEKGISYIKKGLDKVNEKANTINNKLDEIKELKYAVYRLTASIDELQNPQEDLKIIQRSLKEIKDYMPGMKEQIDGVLSQLNSPSSSTTQKLQIVIPIIPQVVTYKVEADAPKFVADIKHELRGLLKFKKSNGFY